MRVKRLLLGSQRRAGVVTGLVALLAIMLTNGLEASRALESLQSGAAELATMHSEPPSAARHQTEGEESASSARLASRGSGKNKKQAATAPSKSTTTAPTSTTAKTGNAADGAAVPGIQQALPTVTTRASAIAPTTTKPGPVAGPVTTTTVTAPPTTARPPATTPNNVAALTVGWTHAQYSADAWFNPAAVASAESVLRTASPVQNQHIFGFGVLNPEPSPGVFDWASLDQRIDMIRRNGGVPTITLCCAPDWMKGGAPGTTDWTKIEIAPDPAHFDDFAQLSAEVAKRYPDVSHFLVWNELKGFWNNALNRWDYEGYTAMYNKIYTAVKAVRPDALLGGPYVVVDTWPNANTSNPSQLTGPWGVFDQRPLDVIEYWNRNKVGGDFVVLDGGIVNKTYTISTDRVTAAAKLETITRWAKNVTGLPVWWGELYPIPPGNLSESEEAEAVMVALNYIAKGGGSVVLLWGPNGTGDCWGCLFTDVRYAGGGAPSELAQRLISSGFSRRL
jgi:hypothetical protein